MKNVTRLATVAVHTAENEPLKSWVMESFYSVQRMRTRVTISPGARRTGKRLDHGFDSSADRTVQFAASDRFLRTQVYGFAVSLRSSAVRES